MAGMHVRALALFCMAALGLVVPQASAAEALASYNVDIKKTGVSGLSSGAYMAHQFHIAFSSDLVGAGIVAGGPFFCARGLLSNALSQCMKTTLGVPDAGELFAVAQGLAHDQRIDALINLVDDSVYLFAGTEDSTVSPEVVAQLRPFYEMVGVDPEKIRFVDDLGAGHALITEDFGGACGETGSPFINDCDYDQAGDILAHIHGALAPRGVAVAAHLLAFDQSEFLSDPNRHGMNETGYLYLPASCAAGAACRVHVVFHGCKQTTADIGDVFVRQSGFNAWAESNDMILLYPQAWATLTNPNGCWDWWGYDDDAYHTRKGRQMAAVKAMLDRLAGAGGADGYCQRHEGRNYAHWQAGRAEICNVWLVCAKGSGESLGWMFGKSTLYEHPRGNFTEAPCGG